MVLPGFELMTSRTADRRSSNWANRAAVTEHVPTSKGHDILRVLSASLESLQILRLYGSRAYWSVVNYVGPIGRTYATHDQ